MVIHTPPTLSFVTFEDIAIEQSIVARFEQQVARYPTRLAVVTPALQYTYTELNHLANRLARTILAYDEAGVGPVALLFEPGASIIAAILGILKAGKIYVPLDPAFPPTRTAYMLEDSQATLLLTNTLHLAQAQTFAQAGQHIVNYDDIDTSTAADNLERAIPPETWALILYTSGSTGQPKGVLHTHRNLLVETRTYTNDLQLCPEDRLALCHACSFANSIRNQYGALLNGATLFPYDLASEGVACLAEWLQSNRITILHTLATTFRRFLDTITADTTFPALRILRLGGEPINREDVQRFQRHFAPPCVLMHAMGPTETFTIRRHFITHAWHSSDSKVPVGYAVPDKEVLLVDDTGRAVGTDQVGEIAVKSKYLALGYWRRPDLTQAAFIPDPLGGEERVYLTGDLGLMQADGCLFHMGRKDFQVKIRGYRVEVAEIEVALLELDSIRAAIVHAQAGIAGEQRLVAYIVPAAGRAPTVSELRRALARTLPAYMLPAAFVCLDTFPLLPNGKIDRRALPVPSPARPALDQPYVAPRTPIEVELERMWATALNVAHVGMHDGFLDLGGDSLLATRLLARVIATFRVELSVQALLATPTIAQMAELITLHQAVQADPATLASLLAEVEGLSKPAESSPPG